MKKGILIMVIGLFSSCSPGRWVPGNKAHFDKRERNREVRDSVRARQTYPHLENSLQ